MDYEKRLKEALSDVNTPYVITAWIEENFPELAESEDESIRKEIYTYLFNELNNTKQLTPITDTFERWLKWLKYDEQKSDIIAEKAKTEKQRVLLTETDGNANIVWDTRSLDDAETLLECGLEYVKKLKATTPYKDVNKEYWRGYREGKQEVLDKYAELEKQGNDSYLQEKIENFTNAHKGEDPEEILADMRGKNFITDAKTQPLILQSDCINCKFYDGFGQCLEHGNNLIENCKDFKKGE